jgi:hypothetical protein
MGGRINLKQLIIAAFPQAAMKFCLADGNKVTDEKQCWQDDANLTLALFLNKYSDIEKIVIVGPMVFTEKIRNDFVNDKFTNLPQIELREK